MIRSPQFGILNHTRAAYLNAPSTCRAQPQVRFGGEADMNRQARLVGSVENDPGCVKTHTSAKCRKNNSPGRHHASRVQYDLILRYAIPSRSFYARGESWSFYTAKTHLGH